MMRYLKLLVTKTQNSRITYMCELNLVGIRYANFNLIWYTRATELVILKQEPFGLETLFKGTIYAHINEIF